MGVIIQGNTIIQGKTIFGPQIVNASINTFNGNVGSSSTVITNTITASTNSTLILITSNGYYTPTSIAVTSSPSLTWTTAISGNGNGFMQGGYVASFVAGGSITVTTTFGGTGLINGIASLYSVINANASPIGATHQQQDLNAQPTYNLTTTNTNSLIFCLSYDINGNYTPTGGTYIGTPTADYSNTLFGRGYIYHYQATSIAAYNVGMTGTFTSSNFYSTFLEIKGN